ncbi:MAG: biotin/lipoate A/B protein ligase family protein [Desulfuromonadales bacterium]|nr:biotin/lipoate A/B protein ligase family protein [Desulfuromonadales bacterium]
MTDWQPRRWRLIRSGRLSGAMNMALDEALLEAVASGASGPLLRLYGWQPATLTLGYAQSARHDIDLTACRASGIDVVRRTTGGRAVLHADELTYALVARTDDPPFAGSVLHCYRVIAEVLQVALRQAGIDAELVPGRREGEGARPAHAVCFTAPAQYELLAAGRKIVGSAQKRRGQAFLQHGSIPLTLDVDLLARLLRVAPDDQLSLRKVGWLAGLTAETVTVARLEELLVDAFQTRLGVIWQESTVAADEQQRADQLHAETFARDAWTLQR